MRISIIVLTLLFFNGIAIDSFADKFVVESFSLDEKDLAARKAEIRDANDDMCAIIKVRTSIEGVRFKTYPNITKIEYKDNPKEIWLFVSPGTKMITFSGPDLITFDYIIPNEIRIESLNVYLLVLNRVVDYTGINTNDKGYFKVETEPPGAKILMEGNPAFLEVSPYDANEKKQAWPVGKKKLSFTYNEYYSKDTVFMIEKDKTTYLNVRLVPIFSFIDIEVLPTYAEIFINGKKIDNWKTKLSKGEAQIVVKAAHFRDRIIDFDVPDGGVTSNFSIQLDTIYGKLKVTAGNQATQNAEIFINGLSVGKIPMTEIELQEGSYLVEAKKQGLVSYSKNIEIKDSKTTELILELSDLVNVLIESEPSGAEIKVNGTTLGYTPKTVPLKLGNNILSLEKSQYLPYRTSLTITENSKTVKQKLTADQQIQAKKDMIKYGAIRYTSLGLITAGIIVGGYEAYNVVNKYKTYQTATTEANLLRKQIITGGSIFAAAIGTVIGAYIPYRMYKDDYRDAKKRYGSFACIPYNDGIYFSMNIKF